MPQATPFMDAEAGTSLWQDAWHRLRKNRMAVVSAAILAALSLLSVLAPWIAPYSYEEQNLALRAVPPQHGHWLGTDALGRDQLTRLLYGGRVSLMVGIVATGVALAMECGVPDAVCHIIAAHAADNIRGTDTPGN